MSRSAPRLMSNSAIPSTRLNAKQLTRKSAPRRDMVKRSVTLFLEKHAVKFQSSLAHRFPGSLAIKSQELSAEMYRGRNASRYRRKIVALRPSRAVSTYLSRNAKPFKKRIVRTLLSRNVSKNSRKCVEMFQGKIVSACLYRKESRRKCALKKVVIDLILD